MARCGVNEHQQVAAHIARIVSRRMCELRGASSYGCRYRNPTTSGDVTIPAGDNVAVSGSHLKTLVNSAAYDAVMEYMRNRK